MLLYVYSSRRARFLGYDRDSVGKCADVQGSSGAYSHVRRGLLFPCTISSSLEPIPGQNIDTLIGRIFDALLRVEQFSYVDTGDYGQKDAQLLRTTD